MPNRLVPVLVILLAALAAAAGCGGGKAGAKADTDPLADTAWTLNGLAGKALPESVAVTVRFEEDRIGGLAGCNRYFASYRVKGDSLRIGPVGITKMMCPEPQMAVEDAFLAALAGVKTFRLGADGLMLRGDGQVLAFTPTPLAAMEK